jgi:hypothetical protein
MSDAPEAHRSSSANLFSAPQARHFERSEKSCLFAALGHPKKKILKLN